MSTSPPAEPSRRPVPPWLVTWSEISVRTLALAIGILVLGWVFLHLAVVTVPAFIALLVTAILEPLVRRLKDRGLHDILATWAVLASVILIFAALIALMAPAVSEQFRELGPSIDEGITEIEDWLEDGPLGIDNPDLRQMVERGAEQVSADGAASKQAVKSATIAGEVLAGFFLALVMVFFFLKDGPKIAAWGRKHLPSDRRRLADRIGRRSWATLSAYIRGTAIVGVVDGALIGIGCAVIGVPLALPLGILTFFGAFFPLVGAVAAGAVAAIVALVASGPVDALIVVGLVVVVQQVEGDVLAPLVMGKALKLHPLVILVALTTGVVLAGILGAFLAVPFTAIAVAVGIELQAERDGDVESDDGPPIADADAGVSP